MGLMWTLLYENFAFKKIAFFIKLWAQKNSYLSLRM